MIERLFTYGDNQSLCGIITEPVSTPKRENAPIFIIINAGILPHCGPYREHVDLARFLAEEGFTSFRFDMHGIGDSMQAYGKASEDERILLDIIQSMDYLQQKRNATTFVVYGLCRGALIAHDIALKDPRIVGTVQVDSFAYLTLKFHCIDRVLPLFSLKKWGTYISRTWKALFRSAKSNISASKPTIQLIQFEPKTIIMNELATIISRKTTLLYIYTGGIPVIYNYENQFWDMFKKVDFKNQAELLYFKNSDHLFVQLSERAAMFAAVADWMKRKFC